MPDQHDPAVAPAEASSFHALKLGDQDKELLKVAYPTKKMSGANQVLGSRARQADAPRER